MKPTVISFGTGKPPEPEKEKATGPTIIKIAPEPPVPVETRKPTAVSWPSTPAREIPQTAVVAKPSAMPGTQRVRIAVKVEDIVVRNPGMRRELQERVVRLVEMTNVDDATDRVAVLWGHETQKAYADLAERGLDLCRSEALTSATKHVSRMTEILGLIDLRKVCGIETGGMFGFLRRTTGAIDTPEELENARVELSQLVRRMNDRVEPLLLLKEEIETVGIETDKVADEMEALAEAAAFISDYLHATNPAKSGLAARFIERSASLTQSLAQIRSGGSARQLQREQPLRLIAAVQHATLVAMPGWLSSIANVLAMLQSARKPNATEVDELGESTAKITQGLNA